MVGRDEQADVAHHLGKAAYLRRHHRNACDHGLKGNEAKPLDARRDDEHVEPAQ